MCSEIQESVIITALRLRTSHLHVNVNLWTNSSLIFDHPESCDLSCFIRSDKMISVLRRKEKKQSKFESNIDVMKPTRFSSLSDCVWKLTAELMKSTLRSIKHTLTWLWSRFFKNIIFSRDNSTSISVRLSQTCQEQQMRPGASSVLKMGWLS